MKKDIGHGNFIGCVASGGFLGKEIMEELQEDVGLLLSVQILD
jgi:hypothetical protein